MTIYTDKSVKGGVVRGQVPVIIGLNLDGSGFKVA
jgi:hypothetical protein